MDLIEQAKQDLENALRITANADEWDGLLLRSIARSNLAIIELLEGKAAIPITLRPSITDKEADISKIEPCPKCGKPHYGWDHC